MTFGEWDPVAQTPVCVEEGDDCEGRVEYHSVDPGRARAFPRCDRHWRERLRRRENSMEIYEHCDVPPPWFDPSIAGEEW